MMRLSTLTLIAAAQQVASHATFQDLWVGSTDMQSSCVRLPQSNSPVTDVTSTQIRCNANSGPVAGKCSVVAGTTVAVEMHQQNGDRSCSNEAIGGDHWGPVLVYMSKVADSSSSAADGSSGWFKIFQDTWSAAPGATSGDGDNWGTRDLNTCCGRMQVKIPSDIPAGDYLLRAEVIALHAATPSGGAQFYMSCYQLTVTGGGSSSPALVNIPGAYKASDPGIGLTIHTLLTQYVAPGPAVYSGGTTKSAGAPCSGIETGTATGATIPTPTKAPTSASSGFATTTVAGVKPTTSAAATGSGSGAVVPKYGQCGGIGWTGATVCAAGSTCQASGSYYSQCL